MLLDRTPVLIVPILAPIYFTWLMGSPFSMTPFEYTGMVTHWQPC